MVTISDQNKDVHLNCKNNIEHTCRPGADLGFSRRGGESFSKFCRSFFEVDHINFLSTHRTEKTLFWPSFCAAVKTLKTQAKKRFSPLFRQCWPKNRVLSARSSP